MHGESNIRNNRFWQMHDEMAGGYIPATNNIHVRKTDAIADARRQAKLYREDPGKTIKGNPRDGYEIEREFRGRAILARTITIHGPLRAQEMGYDSILDCVEAHHIDIPDDLREELEKYEPT